MKATIITPKAPQDLSTQEHLIIQQCLDLRNLVFVQGQGVPLDLEQDQAEYACYHVLLLANQAPVGTLRYRKTEDGVKLERIAVHPQAQGKGYGKQLVTSAIDAIRKQYPVSDIYLHAQLSSEGFYRKLGFIDDGTQIFQEAGIEHRNMTIRSEYHG